MKLGWWAGHDEELGVAKRRWMEKKKMYFELMQVIHPDCDLIYLAVSCQNYFEVQLRWSNKVKSLSTFCGKFSLDMIQKQQCHYKAYIGWTKALCLRQCKVHAFHCFSVRGFIHFLGFFPCLVTSPQLFLFSPPLDPSTFPSLPLLNTFIPVLKIRCQRTKGWRGVSRHGKRRGLNEVGVMGRVTMKGWSVGCNEKQLDGEKENTIHT